MTHDSGRSVRLAGALLALAGGLWISPTPARAADHRDGPRTTNNATTLGGLDINDVYAFVSPSNRNNSVFVMTVGGAAVGIIGPPYFYPGAVYEFRVSNDGDPTTDELLFRLVFSNPDSFLRQGYLMYSTNARTGNSALVASGFTGTNVPIRGGGQVRAGLFRDPFFFDLLAFNKFKKEVDINAPVADRFAPFLPPSIPNNFFGNFNVLAIVVEVPRTHLLSPSKDPNISVWARTLTPSGAQFDRMGRPAINTVVGFGSTALGTANIQDHFNDLNPAIDPSLRGAAAERIHLYFGLPLPQATSLANTLLPDVLTFNTSSTAGFLNGRRLQDDVIDAELSLLTGGALTSDRVGLESPLSNTFPYLAPPLSRTSTGAATSAIRKMEIEEQTPAPSQSR